ncbi:MAG: hypothetical protein M1823_000228 [Watsoniomyces obsoletus]|nr:MAG: hypothetical protein M1823_000228 [Watsoniomyces obsoletus]
MDPPHSAPLLGFHRKTASARKPILPAIPLPFIRKRPHSLDTVNVLLGGYDDEPLSPEATSEVNSTQSPTPAIDHGTSDAAEMQNSPAYDNDEVFAAQLENVKISEAEAGHLQVSKAEKEKVQVTKAEKQQFKAVVESVDSDEDETEEQTPRQPTTRGKAPAHQHERVSHPVPSRPTPRPAIPTSAAAASAHVPNPSVYPSFPAPTGLAGPSNMVYGGVSQGYGGPTTTMPASQPETAFAPGQIRSFTPGQSNTSSMMPSAFNHVDGAQYVPGYPAYVPPQQYMPFGDHPAQFRVEGRGNHPFLQDRMFTLSPSEGYQSSGQSVGPGHGQGQGYGQRTNTPSVMGGSSVFMDRGMNMSHASGSSAMLSTGFNEFYHRQSQEHLPVPASAYGHPEANMSLPMTFSRAGGTSPGLTDFEVARCCDTHVHLEQYLNREEFADCTIELRHTAGRFETIRIPAHCIVIAQSGHLRAQLRDLLYDDDYPCNDLDLETDDRFMTADGFWKVMRFLYGAPMNTIIRQLSPEAYVQQHLQEVDELLGVATAGSFLGVEELLVSCVTACTEGIRWETLERLLAFAFEENIEFGDLVPGVSRKASSEVESFEEWKRMVVPQYGATMMNLLDLIFLFIQNNWPHTVWLERSAPELAMIRRLPAFIGTRFEERGMASGMSSGSPTPARFNHRGWARDRGLTGLRFGDHPTEDYNEMGYRRSGRTSSSSMGGGRMNMGMNRGVGMGMSGGETRHRLIRIISSILLTLPFGLLKSLLEKVHVPKGFVFSLINERESRRRKAVERMRALGGENGGLFDGKTGRDWVEESLGWKEMMVLTVGGSRSVSRNRNVESNSGYRGGNDNDKGKNISLLTPPKTMDDNNDGYGDDYCNDYGYEREVHVHGGGPGQDLMRSKDGSVVVGTFSDGGGYVMSRTGSSMGHGNDGGYGGNRGNDDLGGYGGNHGNDNHGDYGNRGNDNNKGKMPMDKVEAGSSPGFNPEGRQLRRTPRRHRSSNYKEKMRRALEGFGSDDHNFGNAYDHGNAYGRNDDKGFGGGGYGREKNHGHGRGNDNDRDNDNGFGAGAGYGSGYGNTGGESSQTRGRLPNASPNMYGSYERDDNNKYGTGYYGDSGFGKGGDRGHSSGSRAASGLGGHGDHAHGHGHGYVDAGGEESRTGTGNNGKRDQGYELRREWVHLSL